MSDWTTDPKLSGIDPAKLSMLQAFAAQGSNKTQKELLPLLMAAASNSKKKGIQFSPQEITRIIEVLRSGQSQDGNAKTEQMLNLMRMMKHTL
ncbi:MAG: hypothetical protein PHG16_13200 [Lachnospiraceae bacterium]|nr:hypothetical protein [Lachnospiraceae bacterium]